MEAVSKKYLDILEKGRELFWKFGLKRVTVEEICSGAGVSKMTFYKYFRNKDQLALAILRSMIEQKTAEFTELMESEISFRKKVEATIKMKMDAGGDSSKELLTDLYNGDYPELLAYMEGKTKESLDLMASYYRKAQAKGEIRKGLKIEFLMYIIDHMTVMVTDEKLTSMYESGGDLIYEIINFFFYGVLPRVEE